MRTNVPLLNLLTTTLLFLPLLSTATKPQPILRAQYSPFRLLNPLQPREEFCEGINCGNLCIPNGYHCCSDGGAGCPIGSTCVPNGCCPNGETCDGSGGGTFTLPGGSGPAPTTFDSGPAPSDTFSSDSFSVVEPSTTPAATGQKATTAGGGGAAATSENAYDSYLATAYATTAGGGAAASSVPGEVSGINFPSFSSPTFDLTGIPNVPSFTSAASASAASLRSGGDGGGSSGGGSSSGNAQEVAAGAERIGGEVVASVCVVVGGLVALWGF